MYRVLLCIVALSLVGLSACGPDESPVQPNDATFEPVTSFENGPVMPGNSPVFRFEDVWVVGSTDPARDLIVWHFFAADWAGCGGSSVFPLAYVQTVQAPSGALHVVGSYRDIALYVYRLSDWAALPPESVCDFLENDWLYKGTHSMVYTDSDNILGGPGASVWGWKAHGSLEDPDGNSYKYIEQQQARWDFETNSAIWVTENIRVVPIP